MGFSRAQERERTEGLFFEDEEDGVDELVVLEVVVDQVEVLETLYEEDKPSFVSTKLSSFHAHTQALGFARPLPSDTLGRRGREPEKESAAADEAD